MTNMDFILDGRVLGLLICALVVAVATYYEVKHLRANSRRAYLRRELDKARDVRRPLHTVDLHRYQQRMEKMRVNGVIVDELQLERAADYEAKVR